MNDLLKSKKVQLAGLIIGTLGVIGLLWSFVILAQRESLVTGADEVALKETEKEKARGYMALATKMKEDLQSDMDKLEVAEDRMVKGDMFRWVKKICRELESRHRVVLEVSEAPHASDIEFYPKLPHRAAAFIITGTAHYQEMGMTLADFEENYPYCRLQSLQLDPSTGAGEGDAEKLTMRLEFVALLKPDPAQ